MHYINDIQNMNQVSDCFRGWQATIEIGAFLESQHADFLLAFTDCTKELVHSIFGIVFYFNGQFWRNLLPTFRDCNNINDIELERGDIVHRHLMDGDFVLFKGTNIDPKPGKFIKTK